jgi:hypothetical protein
MPPKKAQRTEPQSPALVTIENEIMPALDKALSDAVQYAAAHNDAQSARHSIYEIQHALTLRLRQLEAQQPKRTAVLKVAEDYLERIPDEALRRTVAAVFPAVIQFERIEELRYEVKDGCSDNFVVVQCLWGGVRLQFWSQINYEFGILSEYVVAFALNDEDPYPKEGSSGERKDVTSCMYTYGTVLCRGGEHPHGNAVDWPEERMAAFREALRTHGGAAAALADIPEAVLVKLVAISVVANWMVEDECCMGFGALPVLVDLFDDS